MLLESLDCWRSAFAALDFSFFFFSFFSSLSDESELDEFDDGDDESLESLSSLPPDSGSGTLLAMARVSFEAADFFFLLEVATASETDESDADSESELESEDEAEEEEEEEEEEEDDEAFGVFFLPASFPVSFPVAFPVFSFCFFAGGSFRSGSDSEDEDSDVDSCLRFSLLPLSAVFPVETLFSLLLSLEPALIPDAELDEEEDVSFVETLELLEVDELACESPESLSLSLELLCASFFASPLGS